VGFHEIWHLFVLAGSACLVVLVWCYVLPLVKVL
jgi:predicted membrane channel-forming protein YqfA (hemolysin III family)